MKKWMLSFFIAAMFSAGAARSTEKYVSDWPKERQPQLAGHYKGYVRDWMTKKTACEYKSANLHIQANNRYSLSTRCDRGKGAEEVVTGSWWIDEIAGSCLILMREPPLQYDDERWYGFRIEGDAVSLSQDGGQCTAADERDNGMILRRASKGKT